LLRGRHPRLTHRLGSRSGKSESGAQEMCPEEGRYGVPHLLGLSVAGPWVVRWEALQHSRLVHAEPRALSEDVEVVVADGFEDHEARDAAGDGGGGLQIGPYSASSRVSGTAVVRPDQEGRPAPGVRADRLGEGVTHRRPVVQTVVLRRARSWFGDVNVIEGRLSRRCCDATVPAVPPL